MDLPSLEDYVEMLERENLPFDIDVDIFGETVIPPPTPSPPPLTHITAIQSNPPNSNDEYHIDDLEGMQWQEVISTLQEAVHYVLGDSRCVLEGTQWEDIVSTLQDGVCDLIGDTSIPPDVPAPPPPTCIPTIPSGEAIPIMHDGGQGLIKNNNTSDLTMLPTTSQNLDPVGFLYGNKVYWVAPTQLAAPPRQTSRPKAMKRNRKRDESGARVKKPMNAFMLFSQKKKQSIMAELKTTNRQIITTVLGERWRALSVMEQTHYFMEAHKVSRRHSLQHPGWTPNNSKRRKTDEGPDCLL